MIDEVDRELERWAGNVLGDGLAKVGPLDPAASGRGVSLYLLEVVHGPPSRGARQPMLDLALRYLVTSWSEGPSEAHRLLGELLFAAAASADYEIELGSPPLDLWVALGVPPRPAFILRVPVRRPLPVHRAPLVRRPVTLEIAAAGRLTGLCVGPENIPLAGALVELPALNVRTRTDHEGRFAFSSVPRGPSPLLVRATAKGRTVTVHAGARGAGTDPLVIAFDMTEV